MGGFTLNSKRDSRPATAQALSGRQVRAKIMAAFILYLGASPLYLLPGAYLLHNSLAPALLLPFFALCFTFLAGIPGGRRTRMLFFAAIVLELVISCAWLLTESWLTTLLFLPSLVLMLLFMPAMARPSYLEWPSNLLATGIFVHLFGQAIKGQALFAAAGTLLSLSFSAYLILCLFVFNRYALQSGARSGESLPAGLITRNRRLLFITSAVAVLATNIESLRMAAQAAWLFIKRAIAYILLWLSSLMPQMAKTGEQSGSQTMELPGMAEANEPSAFAQFLEKLMIVAATVLAVLLILYGLYHVFKLLKRVLNKLLGRIRDYTRLIGEGYEDKTESLFDISEVSRAARERWASLKRHRQRPPAWERLGPRDKVRKVYALLMRRAGFSEPSLTAREAFMGGGMHVPPDDARKMASLYELARYSELPVSKEDAEEMRKSAGV